MGSKAKPPKVLRRDLDTKKKYKTKTQTNCNCDIKCFKCLSNKHVTSQCPNKKVMVLREKKYKTKTQTNCNCDIKCFKCLSNKHVTSQCPNKKVMVLREHGKIEYESDKSMEDDMPPLKDCSDAKRF
jgi:hypothetical protein